MPSSMLQGAPIIDVPIIRTFDGHATLVTMAVTRIGPELSKAIMDSLGPVYEYLKQEKIDIPGHNVVFYDKFNPDGSIPIESGVLTPKPITGRGRVVASALPAGRVAVLSHIGPYSEMMRTYEAINAWCAAEGLPLAGYAWEEYDDWHEDPTRLRTDIYRLLG
jgi:effector-binding domain-containing protein